MARILLVLVIGWLILRHFAQQKALADTNARLLALETVSRSGATRTLSSNAGGAYNLADINSRLSNFITLVEVDTYADAVALNTSKFPLRIRVSADENAGNTATTYDYWPNSTQQDKLEQASF